MDKRVYYQIVQRGRGKPAILQIHKLVYKLLQPTSFGFGHLPGFGTRLIRVLIRTFLEVLRSGIDPNRSTTHPKKDRENPWNWIRFYLDPNPINLRLVDPHPIRIGLPGPQPAGERQTSIQQGTHHQLVRKYLDKWKRIFEKIQ